MFDWLGPWFDGARVVGIVLAGALGWILYFRFKDRQNPEPKLFVLFAAGLGMAAAGIAIQAFRVLPILGLPSEVAGSAGDIAVFCLFIAGPIEEGAKFCVARIFIFRSRHFDEEIDGLVYASAVALGFATVENLLYLPAQVWTLGIARSFASPLSHSLFSSIWGFGLSHSRMNVASARGRFLWQTGALLAAMLVHGIYDFVLLAWQAPHAAAGVVLALWMLILIHIQHVTSRRASAQWIKANGLAPARAAKS